MPRDLNKPNRPVAVSQSARHAETHPGRGMWSRIIRGVWVCTVILWPVLRWVIAFDCVAQLIKAMYHWNTPGSHAGLVFILHFLAFSALTYFVSAYRPKGI
jgi:hypothetical protein